MRSAFSSRAMVRGDLPAAKAVEDTAHDRGLGFVDVAPPANGLAARIELTDDIVAIAKAAT